MPPPGLALRDQSRLITVIRVLSCLRAAPVSVSRNRAASRSFIEPQNDQVGAHCPRTRGTPVSITGTLRSAHGRTAPKNVSTAVGVALDGLREPAFSVFPSYCGCYRHVSHSPAALPRYVPDLMVRAISVPSCFRSTPRSERGSDDFVSLQNGRRGMLNDSQTISSPAMSTIHAVMSLLFD